jgi:hypothetical protein
MPVIYATKTGNKGFQACSGTYRQTLLRALEQRDYVTASELFHQAHSLLWLPTENKDEYRHRLYPQQVMSALEFRRIKNLPGSQLTVALVNQQCGGLGQAALRGTSIRRSTPLVGPQLSTTRRAGNTMQRVQRASYEAAERDGFPVQAFKGLGTYGPSPFQQNADQKTGNFTPSNPEHKAGYSSGRCLPDAKCYDNLQCESNVCVVPKAQRQCPPFQYPVQLQDEKGAFVINNPSAKRTAKVSQYSAFWNSDYDTCLPQNNYSAQRWIQDDRLRQYIGLALDVIQIPVNEWIAEAKGKPVLRDPGTQAPYFERAANNNNMVFRVYKLNSAYTPRLLVAARIDPDLLQPPPPPPPPDYPPPPPRPPQPPSSSSSSSSSSSAYLSQPQSVDDEDVMEIPEEEYLSRPPAAKRRRPATPAPITQEPSEEDELAAMDEIVNP